MQNLLTGQLQYCIIHKVSHQIISSSKLQLIETSNLYYKLRNTQVPDLRAAGGARILIGATNKVRRELKEQHEDGEIK